METIRYIRKDAEKMAAARLCQEIDMQLKGKRKIVLGVVGGTSVFGILNWLNELDFPRERVHIFMADERLVSIEDNLSNFKSIKGALDKFPRESIHPFIYKPDKNNIGIDEYWSELQEYGGKFDILVLSAGEDGHTASLFPEHPSIINKNIGFILVDNSPKPPSKRMSASKNLLLKADYAMIIFFGDGKKEAYNKFNNPEIKVEECPCKLVKEIGKCVVVTDLA